MALSAESLTMALVSKDWPGHDAAALDCYLMQERLTQMILAIAASTYFYGQNIPVELKSMLKSLGFLLEICRTRACHE